MSSIWCRWFGIGCPPPAPTPVPPTPVPTPVPPPLADVTFHVQGPDGATLPSASLKATSPNGDWQGRTDAAGNFHAHLKPGHYDIVVSAHGYTDRVLPADLKDAGVIIVGLVTSHVDPFTMDLRTLAKIRGAMWTVPGPWRFGPRPGQPDNITAMEFIYSYGADPFNLNDEQKNMISTYKSYGYTHVAFGPINAASYHGQYPDTDFRSPEMFETWLDWLQMFWDNGLAPICFLHPDGGSFDDTVAMYDHLIRNNPRAQRLMRIIVPSGWEPAKYEWSSYTWAKFAKWGREILPNALVLLHTVADVDAPVGTDALGDDNGKPNGEGWGHITPFLHGWLVQSSSFADPATHGDPNHPEKSNFDNWADLWDPSFHGSYLDRFHHGYAGWPTTSAWGNEPIKVYAAEFCSYWVYWHGRSYAEGVTWGDRALARGADGVLDSCSPSAVIP